MHIKRPYVRLIASFLIVLLSAACARSSQPSQQAVAPTGAAATPAPAAATSPPVLQPSVAPPPAAPTATAGPTATPFPLESGWWDDAVCYELFVRSFFDSDGDGIGDLNGLIAKLDYLNDGDPSSTQDLGVNCVWLMPVAQSPSYHGYDVVDFYTVESDYGTNEDFKRFVAEAHRRGIKVIIDLVLNHTSAEHPWFQAAARDPQSQYRDWYIWAEDDPGYPGPWGEPAWHRSGEDYYYGLFWSGMPDLNYRNPAVTQEALAISRFWVEEMGVDGFRLDAIKHLIENGAVQEHTPETHAWLRSYRSFLQGLSRDVFTVGEALGTPTSILASYYPDQLDSFFEFNIATAILTGVNSGSGSGYLGAVTRAYERLPFQRFAPLLTNHDQNRAMSVLRGDQGRARIAATALLTLPGLPFVYYGEEIGMTGIKPDERLRTPMQWTGESNAGFTTGKPWADPQKNYQEAHVAAQTGDPDSLLSLYRRLIQLHQGHPALGHGGFTPLKSSDKAIAAFLRHTEDESILVVLNFETTAIGGITLSVPASPLAAGRYQLEPLLGTQSGAALSVGQAGAIVDYLPLQSLAPQTGYIWKLSR